MGRAGPLCRPVASCGGTAVARILGWGIWGLGVCKSRAVRLCPAGFMAAVRGWSRLVQSLFLPLAERWGSSTGHFCPPSRMVCQELCPLPPSCLPLCAWVLAPFRSFFLGRAPYNPDQGGAAWPGLGTVSAVLSPRGSFELNWVWGPAGSPGTTVCWP